MSLISNDDKESPKGWVKIQKKSERFQENINTITT